MSPSGSTIAVVVPFHRGLEFVPRLKESFGGQDLHELILVVDDGESAPRLREEFADWPHVRVLETSGSLGTSGARNVGLAAATAEWVAPVDQDDWWPTSFVEDLVLPGPGAVLAYDSVVWRTVEGRLRPEEGTVLEEAGFDVRVLQRDHPALEDYLPMLKLVVRRDDALAVGGWSTWAYAVEDYDFVMRLLGHGLRVEVCASPRGHYLQHDDSITRQIAAGSTARARRAFRTWMRLYARLSLDRRFPLSTRRTFVWRLGVAAKGWALLALRRAS